MRNQHIKNDKYKNSTGLNVIAPKQQTQKDKDRMSRISSLMARTQRI